MTEVFPQKMSVKLATDNATGLRRDSYSHRNTRYCWKTEVMGEREVEYERVQTNATSPTPCIDYVLTITNRIAVQFSVYTSGKKESVIKVRKEEKRKGQKPSQ